MDVSSLIYESLQLLYVYIPKDLVIILLGGLTSVIIFNRLERKKTNEKKGQYD